MTAERIRVLIAGNIYVKRALVRRFLEDDGYEVVAEALTRSDLGPAIRRGNPDAIVVDDALLEPGTIARLRRSAPDAKIVVFTSTPPTDPEATTGADAYLEKGVGLAALTTILGRLFEPDRAPVAVGAVAPETFTGNEREAAMMEQTSTPGSGGGPAAGVARLVAIAGGAILVVVGLIAMITTGGEGTAPAPADTTDQTGGGVVITEPVEETELDAAYAALDRMIAAIQSGNYVLAAVEARALMDAREVAFGAGFSISGLDAEITARLEDLVGTIPGAAAANLAEILGDLFPALGDQSEPGEGSDLVLGTTVTNTGGGDETTTGGGGDGGETVTVGPGDGKEWGHWHKENKGQGGPPPWANGHHNKANK